MPNSLASARGESRLALVRQVPDGAHRRERRAAGEWSARTRVAAPPALDAAEPPPFSAARGAPAMPARPAAPPRTVGAIALVAALGTILLAALAASATLAWAGV